MERSNIRDFFENPFTEEYLRFCSSVIRQNVTAISVVCGLVEDQMSQDNKGLEPGLFDEIAGNCRDLMRAAVVSEILTSKADDFIYVNMDVFAAEFVSGCRGALGNEIDICLTEKSGSYVLTNENALRYLFLAVLRRAVSGGKKPVSAKIGSVCGDDGSVKLYLKLDEPISLKTSSSVAGVSFEVMTDLIAVKLGVSCEITEDSVTITFKAGKDFADPVFECRPYYPSDGTFSAYKLMLGGSDEFSTKNLF